MKKLIFPIIIALIILSGCAPTIKLDGSDESRQQLRELAGCIPAISELKSLASSYNEMGIIDVSSNELNEINSEINKRNIKSSADIILYAGNALKLIQNDTSFEQPQQYAYVFQELKKLNSEFDFDNFKLIENQVVTTLGLKTYITNFINVSFDSNNITYQYDFYKSNSSLYLTSGIIALANKVLADSNAKKRFFEIDNIQANYPIIISLTEEQANFITNITECYILRGSGFRLLSRQEINNIIDESKKIGLMDHLSDDEIELYRQKVHKSYNDELVYITDNFYVLYYFPNIIYNFDTEMWRDEPYKDVTSVLANLSDGDFTPTNIVDVNWSEYSFDFKGKRYSRTHDFYGDWMDLTYLELINQALRENNVDGQFYASPYGGQDLTLIYLTDYQYNYVIDNKVLDPIVIKID